MLAYRKVHTGPKTCAGGFRGGCFRARYVFCVLSGRVEYPMPTPRATGSRIETAGCSNTKLGRVREGMKEVMVGSKRRLVVAREVL